MIPARDEALFEYAPPLGLQRRLGLLRHGALHTKRRALAVVLVAWLPLALLSFLDRSSPALMVGVNARFLIAAPLFVLAETFCARRLTQIIKHFVIGNLVLESNRERFDRAVASTGRLLESTAAEVVAIVAAYGCVATIVSVRGFASIQWSAEMWWSAAVSLPILLALIFGWLWRLFLWTRLLTLIARLDLRVVASHPDRSAGLGFVGHSVRAFAIVAMALSTIVAGQSARLALESRRFPTENFRFSVVALVCIVAAFVLPLVTFVPLLSRTYRRGVVEYGELAADVGRAFEAKWIADPSQSDRKAAVEVQDFSATTDLYQVASNVYGMRLVPLAIKDLFVLIVATLLPFLPLVLLTVPIDVLWSKTKDLLL